MMLGTTNIKFFPMLNKCNMCSQIFMQVPPVTNFAETPSGSGLADTCSETRRHNEDNANAPENTDIWKNLF